MADVDGVLEGKTILIAGVGPGLGGEVAQLAIRDGANVVLGARTADKLRKMADELNAGTDRIAYRATDIGSAEDCQALCAMAIEKFGRLDGVAIVASYDNHMGDIAGTSDEQWRAIMDTNVVGTMHMIEAASDAMKGQNPGGGSIVMIGSQAATLATMPMMAYAASKGAMLSAQHYLVKELGAHKIRVNTVVPTWMWGPPVEMYVQWQAGERGVPEQEIVDEICEVLPLGEIPADEDVAESVVFLCSDRARMVSGQTLYVNAGQFVP